MSTLQGWGGGFEEGTYQQFEHYIKAVDNFKVTSSVVSCEMLQDHSCRICRHGLADPECINAQLLWDTFVADFGDLLLSQAKRKHRHGSACEILLHTANLDGKRLPSCRDTLHEPVVLPKARKMPEDQY